VRLTYTDFIDRKRAASPADLIPTAGIPSRLFPFQVALTEWLLRHGRGALFADCGLGKTLIQLAWADNVHAHTSGDVLILAPLAVSPQTRREAGLCGIEATVCRTAADIHPGINITNHERLHHFADHDWSGIVLDESSILKAFDGRTREALTLFAHRARYRLCCTATPSPNDYEELGGHSEFLDVMGRRQMLSEFFVNDGISAAHWRLKRYGQNAYWQWIATWARMLRTPADLGFDASGFDLPPLTVNVRTVDADSVSGDRLFSVPVATLSERREARRESISDRVEIAAELANAHGRPCVVWCDLNAESQALTRAIPDAVEVTGSQSTDDKEERLAAFSAGEARVIVSKPSIAGWGLNWQHCSDVIFVGLSDSYEQYYQAMRRCWRFGQTRPVTVTVIASNREQTVLENIRRKEREAGQMFELVIEAMGERA
jgi:superfamily II DNA or RNA helicase